MGNYKQTGIAWFLGFLLATVPASIGLSQEPAGLFQPPGTAAPAAIPAATRLPDPTLRYDPGVAPLSYAQPTPAPAAVAGSDNDLEELRSRVEAAETELLKMRESSTSAAGKLAELLKRTHPDAPQLPLIRLSGFFQLDDGLYSQNQANQAYYGPMLDGVGFRRARLQALGNLTEFTRYSIEMDFAGAGRPSFMDVWGEQANLPFFGTIRIGQFRQPTTMDALTSVRHLEFLERSLPYQAMDPFRRVGMMAYRVSEDEMSTLAYSVYATGFTFASGTGPSVYATLGDTRWGTQIGNSGGVSFAIRGTHLLYYDEPAEGRYLMHIGGGFNYSQIGGQGTTGPFAKTYESAPIPEFFLGDPLGGGLQADRTGAVLNTGRILANNFTFSHVELAGNYGSAHFQTEAMLTGLDQMNGPTVYYYGGYLQTGYFLTGENVNYNKQTGVFDYVCEPFHPFMGLGSRGMCGWGAWELAFRWSYQNLVGNNVDPANVLPAPPVPRRLPTPVRRNQSTVAINWWWNRYTRVQFNWIHSMPQTPTPATCRLTSSAPDSKSSSKTGGEDWLTRGRSTRPRTRAALQLPGSGAAGLCSGPPFPGRSG